jgi:hypothetical protein
MDLCIDGVAEPRAERDLQGAITQRRDTRGRFHGAAADATRGVVERRARAPWCRAFLPIESMDFIAPSIQVPAGGPRLHRRHASSVDNGCVWRAACRQPVECREV